MSLGSLESVLVPILHSFQVRNLHNNSAVINIFSGIPRQAWHVLRVSECQIGQHSTPQSSGPAWLAVAGSKSQVIFLPGRAGPGHLLYRPATHCQLCSCYICHCQTQLIINLPPPESVSLPAGHWARIAAVAAAGLLSGLAGLAAVHCRSLLAAGRSLRLDYLKTFISVPWHHELPFIATSDNICFFEVCAPLVYSSL